MTLRAIERRGLRRWRPLSDRPLLAVLLVVAAATTSLAGCGGDDDEGATGSESVRAGIFVGTVEGTDAYIGIKSDGDEVGGYLCNGRSGLADEELVSVWLDESTLADGEAELTTRDGEVVGSVTVTDEGASGEVEIDGGSHPFSAEPASGDAGIAREVQGEPGEPGSSETGWIVLEDGSFRGAKSTTTQAGFINPTTDLRRPTTGFIDPTSDLSRPTTGFIDPTHDLSRPTTGFIDPGTNF